MPEKDQQFIFSKKELALIKRTFSESDVFIYTIRKVFLQFPLTDAERGYITKYVTPEVYDVIKKRMLPDASNEFPINQMPNILNTLVEAFRNKQDEDMAWQFEAKRLEIDYLNQQFAVLKDINSPQPIKWAEMGVLTDNGHDNFINTTAYLFLQTYIDQMLNFLKVMAGEQGETPEQQEKRLTKDSAK